MPWGIERQMWLSKGWSVGAYGVELQPFGGMASLQRTEVAYLRTTLGIGETCATAAMYWLVGLLPAPTRCWLAGIRLWGQMVSCHKDSFEVKAMETQWQMWHLLGRKENDPRLWIGGMMALLRKVGWGTEERRKGLEMVTRLEVEEKFRIETIKELVAEISAAITEYSVDEMRRKICEAHKYEFLAECLPKFGRRGWLESLPRGRRIAVARFMLSQHRLPIETGRWWKMERTERLCGVCVNVGRTCGRKICTCGSPTDRCIGSEKHYVYECCITSKSWMTCKAKVRRKTGIDCDEDSVRKFLNRKGSAKIMGCIGRCWSEFCQMAIEFGEHRWKKPREEIPEEESEGTEERSEGTEGD